MEKHHRPRHGRKTAPPIIGGLLVIMAIVGAVTIFISGFNLTTKILDNTKEKEKFEQIVFPILMLDPVPFEDPTELDNETLLRASLWSTLNRKREAYTVNDEGQMIVPASDVDVSAANLFGKNVELEHKSFSEGFMVNYTYDEETLTYNVPIDARAGYYIPKVMNIDKKGNIYSLLVGYVSAGDGWAMNLDGEKLEPTPSKYMVYELQKDDDNYILVTIKDPEDGAIPGLPIQQNPDSPEAQSQQEQPQFEVQDQPENQEA